MMSRTKAARASKSEAKLWTVEEVARFLSVPASLAYERTRKDEIPCVRIGPRLLRFDPDAVRAWAARRGRAVLVGEAT